jgi:hypothetical protein
LTLLEFSIFIKSAKSLFCISVDDWSIHCDDWQTTDHRRWLHFRRVAEHKTSNLLLWSLLKDAQQTESMFTPVSTHQPWPYCFLQLKHPVPSHLMRYSCCTFLPGASSLWIWGTHSSLILLCSLLHHRGMLNGAASYLLLFLYKVGKRRVTSTQDKVVWHKEYA